MTFGPFCLSDPPLPHTLSRRPKIILPKTNKVARSYPFILLPSTSSPPRLQKKEKVSFYRLVYLSFRVNRVIFAIRSRRRGSPRIPALHPRPRLPSGHLPTRPPVHEPNNDPRTMRELFAQNHDNKREIAIYLTQYRSRQLTTARPPACPYGQMKARYRSSPGGPPSPSNPVRPIFVSTIAHKEMRNFVSCCSE